MDTEKLKELKELFDAGALSEDEFAEAKQAIIKGSSAARAAPAVPVSNPFQAAQPSPVGQLEKWQKIVGGAGVLIAVASLMPFFSAGVSFTVFDLASEYFPFYFIPLAGVGAVIFAFQGRSNRAAGAFLVPWGVAAYGILVAIDDVPRGYRSDVMGYLLDGLFEYAGIGMVLIFLSSIVGLVQSLGSPDKGAMGSLIKQTTPGAMSCAHKTAKENPGMYSRCPDCGDPVASTQVGAGDPVERSSVGDDFDWVRDWKARQ